ncbi:glucosyltransferase domain-containing protein [Enterococcus ureasiticus]|nr:glucosyltransferase domain-containing protein [Enterococcus sp. DIV0849a]MBO0474155.1 glucosyltransferase domain-containing protein [Enterococcus ureasiticus]
MSLIFLIYLLANLAIGIVNFPYLDDVGRQLWGYSKFAEGYSRWGSEILAWVIQGSRHLTDLGLASSIITAIILTTSSSIVVYTLNDKKLEFAPMIVSTIIGLNPWFLQNISFRFDAPFMAFSILFSVVPFLWWESKKHYFFAASFIGIFLMCNTYQASSGLYILLVLALSFKKILANEKWLTILKQISLSTLAYIVAMLVYVFETKLNPELTSRGGNVAIASLKDIPAVIVINSKMYLHRIMEQSTRVWIWLFLILLILFIFVHVTTTKTNLVKNLFFSLVYLVLGSILSYGVFLIFPEKLALAAPRYAYGFSVFVVITLILLLNRMQQQPALRITIHGFVYLFCFYLLSFPFIYASSLFYQLGAFERQSLVLASDLKNLVHSDKAKVYSTMLFKESPVFENTAKNYPILKDLVPTNTAFFWPNQVLFKTYSGMNFDIQPFNLEDFKQDNHELAISDYYYDVYKKDQDFYIIVK